VTYSIHPDAEVELGDAAMYYATHASGLIAAAFLVEFERVRDLLIENQRPSLLVVVVLADTAGSVEIEKFFLLPTADEATKGDVHSLALCTDFGQLHGFSHELFVENNVRAHRTPPYVNAAPVYAADTARESSGLTLA
jgi:hypothetical protein